MKLDIVLSGVGGQGILTIAAVIGSVALKNELFLKQAEVHGMSQRGGDVQSHLRIAAHDIASDLIPLKQADLVLSVEPMEALRYLPYLATTGWLISNSVPFVNIPNYPDIEKLLETIQNLPQKIILNADDIARNIKAPRASNMVMLGAAVPFLPFPVTDFELAISQIFNNKGTEIIDSNLKAMHAGIEISKKQSNK